MEVDVKVVFCDGTLPPSLWWSLKWLLSEVGKEDIASSSFSCQLAATNNQTANPTEQFMDIMLQAHSDLQAFKHHLGEQVIHAQGWEYYLMILLWYNYHFTRSLGAQLLAGGPSGLLTSSFGWDTFVNLKKRSKVGSFCCHQPISSSSYRFRDISTGSIHPEIQDKKMLESRPEDALVKLVNLVKLVKLYRL